MIVLKKLLSFLTATIVALYLTAWSLDAFGFRSPTFAFLLNWLMMSWVAIVGQAVPVSLPSRYYEFKAFERAGQIYEHLGIRLFKRLVRRGPLAVFSPTLRFPKEKTVPALQDLDREMRKAETGHLFLFLVLWVFIIYALLNGWFNAVGWLLLFNVIINGYPIMLQRYNRIKLQELIHKQAI